MRFFSGRQVTVREIGNDRLGENSFIATPAMMFIHYSTSPECNKCITNTYLYMREERRETNTEQKGIDKKKMM